jgi:hypothetical protein
VTVAAHFVALANPPNESVVTLCVEHKTLCRACLLRLWGTGVEPKLNTVDADTAADLMTLAAGDGSASTLFVINLYASIMPAAVEKTLPGLENYRLYQVTRVEDGRTRYRLRLGFFTTEAEADSVLATVRTQYPTAFTTCLCHEDRRFTRGYAMPAGLSAAPPAPAPAKQAKPAAATNKPAPEVAKQPAAKPISAAQAPATTKPKAPASCEAVIELSWEPEKTPARAAATPAAKAPAQAAKPAPKPQIADVVELSWEPPAKTPAAKPAPAKTPPAKAPAAKAVAAKPVVAKAPEAEKAPPASAKPVATPAAKGASAPAKPAPKAAAPAPATPAPKAVAKTGQTGINPALTLTEEPISKPTAATPSAKSGQPFHVGRGVDIPDMELSLHTEAKVAAPASKASAAAGATAKAAAGKPEPTRAKQGMSPVLAMPSVDAPTHPPTAAQGFGLPDLDSTQTIRTLTSAELNDDSQEKWFAIQLAISEHSINLDTMPQLDIFQAYRLYSVANAGSGKIVHSLRLGFFREAVSAEAVGGYLKTFFASPSVLRISIAEHARFQDAPTQKRSAAPSAPKGEGKVIELNQARDRARSAVPTVTMEVASNATGSHKALSATGSYKKLNATGAHKALNATGAHKALSATGSYKKLTATGAHQALNATGKHKALTQPGMKAAGGTKRADTGANGRLKIPSSKSLEQQLLDEAREVELSESGIRKLPKNDSLLTRLVDKLTK